MSPAPQSSDDSGIRDDGKIKLKVLFCGMEFTEGWNQTKLAVEQAGLGDKVDIVRCDRGDVPREIVDADLAVPLMTRLDAAVLDKAKRLAMVLQFGVGLEGVDEAACTELGILLARIESQHTGNAHATAEMAVYLTLAATREVWQMQESIENRILGSPMGKTLNGKDVLIIGWGNVGKKVAQLLTPFGCKISATKRSMWCTVDVEPDPIEDCLVGKYVGSPDLWHRNVTQADIIILACTQTSENKGMIDSTFLGRMKAGSALVNVARGGLFDPDACVEALESGQLGYLASDVAWEEPLNPTHPLVTHERSYFTPHVGGVTDASYGFMGQSVAEVARAMVERKGWWTLLESTGPGGRVLFHYVVSSPNISELERRFSGWQFLYGPEYGPIAQGKCLRPEYDDRAPETRNKQAKTKEIFIF